MLFVRIDLGRRRPPRPGDRTGASSKKREDDEQPKEKAAEDMPLSCRPIHVFNLYFTVASTARQSPAENRKP